MLFPRSIDKVLTSSEFRVPTNEVEYIYLSGFRDGTLLGDQPLTFTSPVWFDLVEPSSNVFFRGSFPSLGVRPRFITPRFNGEL